MRDIVFISKATPEDDEFVLWLAPRLEAAGYTVFADMLNREPGGRWRNQVTAALQDKAAKMLLCCRDATLAKNGVRDEIGIAEELAKELKDPRFIIPLRIEKFKKVFGIGELQWVDFIGSWAHGLHGLLEALGEMDVPRVAVPAINQNWENYKKGQALQVEQKPEVLTSNWLRVASVPETIRFYQPTGAINHGNLEKACRENARPAEFYNRGFFSFASPEEVERDFAAVGRFELHSEHMLLTLMETGSDDPHIRQREAQNLVTSIFRRAWEGLCRSKGLHEYAWSSQPGFHVGENLVPLRRKIPWGRQDKRRSSMLRNVARGKVWQYGVSAWPQFWPYPHFKIKARVLFAEPDGKKTGAVIVDTDRQHRLRRTNCKGWRNKAWHGRLMAFLELLSGEAPYIALPLAEGCEVRLDVSPVLFTSPVATALPDAMDEDAEESDDSTLGNFHEEDDE